MRNAASVLGVIGGVLAMVVGFFGYGYTTLVAAHAAVGEAFGTVENAQLVQLASFLAPVLAIAGGAMARARALWGGLMLLAAAALMYQAFGYGVFTMFPIGFAAIAGLLALAAGKPDAPRAHF